ncbi:hydroxyacylglutathione hydrolase [Thauera sp.]|jgi:hydroxyacylglutathione hydrolase|uniref:hydroxyacylglutathione hydrolase n=1 Tax=Thauera sp. TaxID=1905334 RepID=UPI00261D7483|nr:hydroxyacylglutathione hydrolase [Thauera sp.]MCK6409106.1 hydroxyacylglutathione hydrolase [Thauera sp.]
MKIIPVPAFRDNYIWLVHDGRHALVVDPGDAVAVEDALRHLGLELGAILVTHHHPDHTGGLAALLARRGVPVFGPAGEAIEQVDHPVFDGDEIRIASPGIALRVLEVPGHTAGHIAFVGIDSEPGLVFCGDTLFSAGCGRLFEGSPAQMQHSLARLAALPPDTRVYCTHEYTLSNLAFARVAEPHNPERDAWAAHCEALRARGEPTLPSTIGRERAINPFLRCDQPGVIDTVAAHAGRRPQDALECLADLRAWKDSF